MTDRPRFLITCEGTTAKPHKPEAVAVHTRFDPGPGEAHGFWAPTYSGVTPDGASLILGRDKVNADRNQFTWPCPRRDCSYEFRHDQARVNAVLDRLHAAGIHERSLKFLDAALRHTG